MFRNFIQIEPETGKIISAFRTTSETIPSIENLIEIDDYWFNKIHEFRFPYYENGQIVKKDTRSLDEIKQEKLEELKRITYGLLSATDWIIIKCVDLGINHRTEYPEEMSERDSIRAWNAQKEQQINEATSKEEVLSIELTYP